MTPCEANRPDEFPLTDEHRMLLRIRETLYEGSWEDFTRDLQARLENRPHIFETVPASPAMKETMKSHLAMIDQMRTWEVQHRQTLLAGDDSAGEH